MSQTIADNLRRFRAKKDWTQLHLARAMGLKTHASVGHWEGGQTPDRQTVEKLANAFDLGLTVADIDPLGEAYSVSKRKPRGPSRGKTLQKSHASTDTPTIAPKSTPSEAGVLMDAGGLLDIPDTELFRKVLGVYLTLDTPAERAEFVKHARSFVPASSRAKNNRR